jgi:hypothetical protein
MFLEYPAELGMSIEEFRTENRVRLRDLVIEINKRLHLSITKEHQSALDTAVRKYLESKGIREPAAGAATDLDDRKRKLSLFKERLPYWKKPQ